MLKRINDFLAELPMTIVGGVLLVFSFVLPRVGVNLPVDPAWGTVVISGIPLLYLAVWRIIYNPGISKISSALLITIAMFAAIAIGDLFAAGEVAFIMAIGALLEDATTNRAKKGLKKLISLAPTQGRRIRNGKEELIPGSCLLNLFNLNQQHHRSTHFITHSRHTHHICRRHCFLNSLNLKTTFYKWIQYLR